MQQYKTIQIYSPEDFAPGTSIAEARQQLEASTQQPSLLIFGTQLNGCNLGVGQHTSAVAEIIGALTQNDADASETEAEFEAS